MPSFTPRSADPKSFSLPTELERCVTQAKPNTNHHPQVSNSHVNPWRSTMFLWACTAWSSKVYNSDMVDIKRLVPPPIWDKICHRATLCALAPSHPRLIVSALVGWGQIIHGSLPLKHQGRATSPNQSMCTELPLTS